MTYAHAAYQKAATTVIYEPERLVVMVYEGINRFLGQAREAMETNQPARKGEYICKVIALVTELDCALDREAGGEIADNLGDLYQWMLQRITEANRRNDPQGLEEIETVVTQLLEGFQDAAQQLTGAGAAKPAAVAAAKTTLSRAGAGVPARAEAGAAAKPIAPAVTVAPPVAAAATKANGTAETTDTDAEERPLPASPYAPAAAYPPPGSAYSSGMAYPPAAAGKYPASPAGPTKRLNYAV